MAVARLILVRWRNMAAIYAQSPLYARSVHAVAATSPHQH